MSPTLTVLIVDDEADTSDLLRRLFERAGWLAPCVNDSREAAEVLRSIRPDVVLLDLMMPFVDGFEVLRRIRADAAIAGTPVVMYSAVGDERTRLAALEAGANDYIVKTTPFSEIRERVGRVVAESAEAGVRSGVAGSISTSRGAKPRAA
jgi:DNA-binding response OmpR family regulator